MIDNLFQLASEIQEKYKQETGETMRLKDALPIASQVLLAWKLEGVSSIADSLTSLERLESISDSLKSLDVNGITTHEP